MEYWKLVWLFAVAFLFGGYQSEGLWEIEKAALKPFYQNWYLNGDQFPNWLLENNKKLEKLNLVNSSLSGHFLLPSTSRRGLSRLDVSSNSLDGNIPNEIGAKLPSLELLNMSNNFFTGGVPISIGGMISLQLLDLSNNKLSGGIPRHLAMGLVLFDVSNNQLFGDIPSSMENMSLLSILDISSNTLSGGIPRWMGKMSNLEALVMANNHFEGLIPMEFCKLNYSLKFLGLSANNISGSLFIKKQAKRADHHLSALVYLLLKNNHLEGGIPVQLCKLNRLRLIDVSNNNLSGTIPPCLMNTISSDSSHAYYSGSYSADVPIEFTVKSISYFYKGRVLTYLSGIDLSCNKLTGEVPLQL
ncbi:receptor-like protein 45 [Gossypium hirsutum]|uniref:Receptor-like protein 45 n=1 Tax=Gossypium hirsutum TaxID=3635 RepID=A0ABM3BC11_GOSHI|nr:receptor-like protein 45 [Gossypium hirsutum]